MTKQILFISLTIFCFFSCLPNSNNSNDVSNGNDSKNTNGNKDQVIPPFEVEFPDEYKILTQASGDLTFDGVEEKVLVLNTGQIGDMGEERVLLVFQIENEEWKMIHRASGPILPSEHGGMMGDPLQSVSVEKDAILIKHFGGSRVKWENTHRFRLQKNKWELVGATLITEDACIEKETFDYNLSTGRVMYSHVGQVCEQGKPRTREVFSKAGFVSKMDVRPQMNGFKFGTLYAMNPRTGKCIPKDICAGLEIQDEEVVTTTSTGTGNNEQTSTTEPPVILPTGGTNNETTSTTSSDNLDELVGIYTASRNDKSWILTIFPQKGKMEVSYYEVAGLLDDIELIIEGYTPQILKKFELDDSDNSIISDLGKGEVGDFGGKTTIKFFDVKSDDGHELELIKNEEYGF